MGPGQRPPEGLSLEYRLGDAAARTRARSTALLAAASALAPLALVVVLLQRLGYASGAVLIALVSAIVVLAAARSALTYRKLSRYLAGLSLVSRDDTLVVDTPDARLTIPRASVKRIIELAGALGGLRLELVDGEGAGEADDDEKMPSRIDVPRGGERFGELRELLESWCAVERAPRRSRLVWMGVAIVIVGALFFLPFALEDFFAKSRVAAIALVLGTWGAMRFIMRRR